MVTEPKLKRIDPSMFDLLNRSFQSPIYFPSIENFGKLLYKPRIGAQKRCVREVPERFLERSAEIRARDKDPS